MLSVSECLHGSVFNVEGIWREHSHFVYRLCLRLTRDRLLAEDLRQEVFVRIMAQQRTFRGEAHLRSWIYSIARNCCMDFFRQERRRRTLVPDAISEEEYTGETNEALQVRESTACVWNIPAVDVSVCTHLERVFLDLHFKEDLAYKDMAVLLGMSRTAVSKKIHKAISAVKKGGD